MSTENTTEQEFDDQETEPTDQDFEAVAGVEDNVPDDAEPAKTPIRLTPEILKQDQRKTDIVEVCLSTGEAKVVKKSDAPKLTKKVLKEKGAPIQTAEIYFDDDVLEVDYWHGTPLGLELEVSQLLKTFEGRDMADPAVLKEREESVKHLRLSRMIVDPVFSLAGEPADGYAIEECSPILLNALWDGYMAINVPLDPDIYQTKVLRGVPLETSVLIGKTFESYPTGEKLRTDEMPDDELEMFVERSDAQRAVFVSTMLLDPCLSLNGEGNGKHPYPTEQLSEKMMQSLFSAYQASNAPKARADFLNRFRTNRKNRKRRKRRT